MKFIQLLLQNRLDEAKQNLFENIRKRILEKLEETKKELVNKVYNNLDEANIMRMGRVSRIRRRIRRNPQGRIIVQRNRRRSNIPGYRIVGQKNIVKRIPATVRMHKSRMLKRSWRTTRKGKLRRSLMKRTQSLRRRQSMGIR
jgi:hypothetical protein